MLPVLMVKARATSRTSFVIVSRLHSGPQLYGEGALAFNIANHPLALAGHVVKASKMARAFSTSAPTAVESNLDALPNVHWRGLVSMSANDPKRTFHQLVAQSGYGSEGYIRVNESF
jgi:hypothetical protein